MALNTLEYLNLSAIAYLDIDKLSIGKDIAQLIEDKVISEKDLNSPELSALQDPSNPLRSWKVIAQSPSSVSEVKVYYRRLSVRCIGLILKVK